MSKHILLILMLFGWGNKSGFAQELPKQFKEGNKTRSGTLKNSSTELKPKATIAIKPKGSSAQVRKEEPIKIPNNKNSGSNALLTANFISTEDCDIEIDGTGFGKMLVGVIRKLKLSPGRHQLKATGKLSLQVYEAIIDITADGNQISIPLAAIAARIKEQQSQTSQSSGAHGNTKPAKVDSLTTRESKDIIVSGNESKEEKETLKGVDGQSDKITATDNKGPVTATPEEKAGNSEPNAFRGQILALVKGIKSNMIYIKGGVYKMGGANDVMEHQVSLGPFFFSKYEITQQQWELVMGVNPSANKSCKNCPVENVSWEEVNRFIEIVNEISGVQFRLPTEAEWQFVARVDGNAEVEKEGGVEQFLKKTNWYQENASRKTHPVGEKTAHASGVYDLFGNVSEWCLDYFGNDFSGNAEVVSNPKGPASGKERVIRGGSFSDIRIAQRDKLKPTERSKTIGFRLVMQ